MSQIKPSALQALVYTCSPCGIKREVIAHKTARAKCSACGKPYHVASGQIRVGGAGGLAVDVDGRENLIEDDGRAF